MRSRALLSACFVTVVLFALPLAAHAAIPFFGPIIPNADNTCAAGWGMIIIVINNIISFSITIAIVFVAPIMIAWAGFLYVVNPYDPSGMNKAKEILKSTVIGIVVALAAWLIVDAVMAVLYNPAAPLKAWSEIIDWNGNKCLIQASSLQNLNQSNLSVTGLSASGMPYLAPVSGDCSTSALISNGISSSIATKMSCIAQQESSCNLTAQNPNSTAHGLFQVVMGYNDAGHNLNFASCTTAAQRAGYPVTGNLNCSRAFSGGRPLANNMTLANACIAASSNATCNAQAAQWLYNHGGFTHWAQTAPRCGATP